MKILWFTLTPSGVSAQLSPENQYCGWLSALEKHLACSEHIELHVCFQWDSVISSFSEGRVTYHPIRRIRTRSRFLRQLLGKRFIQDPVQSYLEVISKVKPDLIHVHGTEEAFGLIQTVTNIPVIISIQGIISNCCSKYFTGISPFRSFIHERTIDHLKFKSILSNYLIFYSNSIREKKILSMSRYVIGRTDWDRRITALLAPNAQYHHGDEILRSPFYEGFWDKQYFSSPLRIITVSSVAPYKGFETILLVSRILQEYVGINFTWTVIGLSPNDATVKVAYKWIGKNEKVELLGTRSGKDICAILLDSDIFCQVSHIENSPNSLCEAMILGMPIVASYAGGTDSLMCSGKEGILVQDGDPLSTAGAILELSQHFERATKMGRAARARALVRHDPARIVNEVLSIYKRVSCLDSHIT